MSNLETTRAHGAPSGISLGRNAWETNWIIAGSASQRHSQQRASHLLAPAPAGLLWAGVARTRWLVRSREHLVMNTLILTNIVLLPPPTDANCQNWIRPTSFPTLSYLTQEWLPYKLISHHNQRCLLRFAVVCC